MEMPKVDEARIAKKIKLYYRIIICVCASVVSFYFYSEGCFSFPTTAKGSGVLANLIWLVSSVSFIGMIPAGAAFVCCNFFEFFYIRKYGKEHYGKPKKAVPIHWMSYPPIIQNEVDESFSLSFKISYFITFMLALYELLM